LTQAGATDALRRDVEALCAIVRDSAGPGERESARLVARRLTEAGAAEVRIEPYRFQRSWGPRHALHFAAGIAASATRSPALALAALASFDAEFSGRSQWLARLLPGSEGANVVARLPARGGRRGTLVLVAHHDAAQTGWVWRHRVLAGRDTSSRATLQELAFLLAAAPSPRLRAAGAALLGLGVATALDVARGPTVPGASDNASGVAAVIDLIRRFAADPPHRTEVIAVIPGAEESGMGGMRAWLDGGGRALDPGSTLVLGLDTLGAGEPVVLCAEGPPRSIRYRGQDLAWAARGADRAGMPRPAWTRLGAWTDPALAVLAGLPAISLVSMRDGAFTNYHLPSDTPDRVDWDSVAACARLAEATAREWAERPA
jgi:Peptidase family M28